MFYANIKSNNVGDIWYECTIKIVLVGGDLRLAADFVDHLLTGEHSIACTEVTASDIVHKIVFADLLRMLESEVVKIK